VRAVLESASFFAPLLDEATFDAAFEGMDTDHDGVVSFAEFCDFLDEHCETGGTAGRVSHPCLSLSPPLYLKPFLRIALVADSSRKLSIYTAGCVLLAQCRATTP